ncbi:tumor necrosis factor receptor superfamily member 1A-like isoform X2 [Lemur catta]|uniref:tumor necrosis factor receptor superfamily member 1A-like isoform X2 n=1 Tax=Lemur catta TaxID=9447 RepID=UPI001E26AE38|nr:tumor necrosis factor receptor superfamily member 1A-like isoform X2 [Lemur catta]
MVARVLRPLLLLAGSVTFATSVTSCGPDMYPSEDLCCKLCPAGYYVSRHCSTNHSRGECTPCGPGTFMAHNNSRLYCQLCNQCREDQEPVTNCSATSDRQCQCKTGQYYCDSADCTEICFRCSRCPGGRKPLRPCNATANTVCPEPGRHRVQQWMGKFLKRESNEPGISFALSSSPRVTLLPTPTETLLPADASRDHPAPGAETTALLQEENSALPAEAEAEASPGPLEAPGESPVGQVLVAEGSTAAPEQAPHTRPPAARGPQGWTKATAPLGDLEKEYAQKYFLKDMSCDATNRIYYEIGHEVPKSKWKMFMRFIQLEENEIEICEHENPGNVMEQHHKMLLRWRNNHGKDSSVFKLMAALHTMGLDVPLQNIISKLLAEDILGRHAGTPS